MSTPSGPPPRKNLRPNGSFWCEVLGNEHEIATNLRNALAEIGGLSADDVENIAALIRVGEWTIALETICSQIYEHDLDPDMSVREELIRLGRRLKTPAAHLLGDPSADPNEGGASAPG